MHKILRMIVIQKYSTYHVILHMTNCKYILTKKGFAQCMVNDSSFLECFMKRKSSDLLS